jgi:hypothetical protein
MIRTFLLGAVAAVLGALLGLALFGGVWAFWQRPGRIWAHQPVDVPAGAILGVVGLAVISAGVAAMLPARGLGKLQVAAALAGRDDRSNRPRGSALVEAEALQDPNNPGTALPNMQQADLGGRTCLGWLWQYDPMFRIRYSY